MVSEFPPTTNELQAAFARCRGLHLMGWNFAKAMRVDTVRWALEKSALAARRTKKLPAQMRLI